MVMEVRTTARRLCLQTLRCPPNRVKSSGVVRRGKLHASITMTLDRYSHWIPSMGNSLPTVWTRLWDRVYCCPTAATASDDGTGDSFFFSYLQELREGDRRGSNPRPSEPQSDALPTELRPPGAHEILPGKVAYRLGFSPPIPGARSSCRLSCLRPQS